MGKTGVIDFAIALRKAVQEELGQECRCRISSRPVGSFLSFRVVQGKRTAYMDILYRDCDKVENLVDEISSRLKTELTRDL